MMDKEEEEIERWPIDKIQGWLRYFRIEPAGPIHETYMFGVLASLIYNSNRGKDAPALSPSDIFPVLKTPEQEEEEERREAMRQKWGLWLWAKYHGA